MFSRLINKVKEESTNDLVGLSLQSNNRSPSTRHISSTQSDGHLSSTSNDDAVSSSSKQVIEHVVNDATPINEPVNTTSISVDEHDTSIKSQLKELNQSLLNQIDSLRNEMNLTMDENRELRAEINRLNSKIREMDDTHRNELDLLVSQNKEYEAEITTLKDEKHETLIKNAELSQKYELLKLLNTKQQQQLQARPRETHENDLSVHNPSNDPNEPAKRTNSIRNSSSEDLESLNSNSNSTKSNQTNVNVQQKIDENRSLKEELNEKNKLIKVLQQRLNDMKKTLQKELKYQSLPNEMPTSNKHETTPKFVSTNASSAASATTTTTQHLNGHISTPVTTTNYKRNSITNHSSTFGTSNSISTSSHSIGINSMAGSHLVGSINNSQLNHLHDDVNFKYLKHVILKFVTSREYEALHLVKALSVLLNFNKDEEKVLKEFLEWKMSWFGTKPKIL